MTTRTSSPEEARRRFREGLVTPTSGWAAGCTQADPVPLLDVTDAGDPRTVLAPGADLRTDLPAYRVWRYGELVEERTEVTDHVGSPAARGIADLARPDYGDPVDLEPDDAVFWACGVTPQAALAASRPPFAITHAPGHMFVTDVPDAAYRLP